MWKNNWISDWKSDTFGRGLDGVKLSHRNPSENIWTFAAAFAEKNIIDHINSVCPRFYPSYSSLIPDPPSE